MNEVPATANAQVWPCAHKRLRHKWQSIRHRRAFACAPSAPSTPSAPWAPCDGSPPAALRMGRRKMWRCRNTSRRRRVTMCAGCVAAIACAPVRCLSVRQCGAEEACAQSHAPHALRGMHHAAPQQHLRSKASAHCYLSTRARAHGACRSSKHASCQEHALHPARTRSGAAQPLGLDRQRLEHTPLQAKAKVGAHTCKGWSKHPSKREDACSFSSNPAACACALKGAASAAVSAPAPSCGPRLH